MLRNGVIVILIFVSMYSVAQDWIRIYGDGKNANIWYVIETYDHGFLFDASYNKSGKTYTWLFKTNVNGDILWEKQFGTEGNSIMSLNIEQSNDNGYILCGTTTKHGSSDPYAMKLNTCGEIEWCKVIITPNNYDLGRRIKQTTEGDYVLLTAYILTNPISNTSLFKFNSSGELIWHQFYPLDSLYYNDLPKNLVIDSDGYLILTNRYYPDPGQSGGGTLRSNLIKTDTAGNELWNTVYVDSGYYYSRPWASTLNQYGHYYVSCTHTIYTSGDNPAIIKVLHNGDQSYNHDIINTGTFNLSGMGSIDILHDTNFVMFGGWNISGDISNVVIKTDTMGNLRDSSELVETTNPFIRTTMTSDNKFVSAANDAEGATWKIYAVKVNSDLEYDSIYTQPFTYDSLCPYPIVSDTVEPDCNNVYVDVEEPFKDPETTKLKVFPNPATDHLKIKMPKYLIVNNTSSTIPSTTIYHQWGSATLEVYNLFGRKILEREVIRAEREVELDVSDWQAGMHIIRLLFQNQVVSMVKFVVE